jgi:hypothetical protein
VIAVTAAVNLAKRGGGGVGEGGEGAGGVGGKGERNGYVSEREREKDSQTARGGGAR